MLSRARFAVFFLIILSFAILSGCGGASAFNQSSGSSATPQISLSVAPAELPLALVSEAYDAQMNVTGGRGPYSWAVTSGNLPNGLSLSQTTGAIAGTPQQEDEGVVTIAVRDASGQSATKIYSLPVVKRLVIATSTVPNATTGTPYSATLSANGGKSPYKWQVSSGTLPTGVALNGTTGELSGTTAQPGSFSFAITASDSSTSFSQKVTKTYTLTVNSPTAAPLAISTVGLPNGTSGSSYSTTLAATGGQAPYKWAIASGTLPLGLSLTASGALTGTPTESGTFSVAVSATDSASRPQVATKSFDLTINPGAVTPLTITSSTLSDGTEGVAYSASLAASGGQSPYKWQVTSGSLPNGITLDSVNGTLSGMPTKAGTYTLSVSVTDSAKAANSASKQMTLLVQPAPVATLTITTTTLPEGAAGADYNATLQATGGKAPYTWSVSGGQLPSGLALSAAGAITGKPTSAGQFTFTARVTDSASFANLTQATLQITIDNVTAPTISGITATVATPTSAIVSWSTDVPSDSLVFWGTDTGFGSDNGVTDTFGTLSHSLMITGLHPGQTYSFGVRSRPVVAGTLVPSKAAFYTAGSLKMPAVDTAGAFDYFVDVQGAHHVVQGYELYTLLSAGYISGTANFKTGTYKITIKDLPPNSAIHWPDQEYNGLGQGSRSTTYTANDTITFWSPNNTQFELVTNVGGTTPTGTYTVHIVASTKVTDGSDGPMKDIPWTVTVQERPVFAAGTPTSYPAIPSLDIWKSWMTTYGAKWCLQTGAPYDQDVWYYDGARVYYQIQDYTQDTATWAPCVASVLPDYRNYVIANNGAIPGYKLFPHGLYTDYLRTGDTVSRDAVGSLAMHTAGASLWSGALPMVDPRNIRESSYLLNANRLNTKLGNDRSQQTKQLVATVLGHIDQIAVSQNSIWHQPFMDGLAAEALIAYYEDGHQDDVRIPAAIKTLADYLWANAWNRAEYESGAFYYNSYQYSVGMPLGASEMKGLNLLIAPMYAWLFKITGDAKYQAEGDEIFRQAFTAKPGDTVSWSGKNFSQNYRWSFDYVKWRSQPSE